MIANPSAEVDDSRSIPLMVFTADSILLVTSLSTSSGEAPGTRTLTATNGMSMFGQRSTVSREYDTRPRKTSPKISTEAARACGRKVLPDDASLVLLLLRTTAREAPRAGYRSIPTVRLQ